MPESERLDRRRTALIAYDVCRRALTPSDPARRAATRPVLDAWVEMIAVARAAGVPVIYTTPVSRADGADVVMDERAAMELYTAGTGNGQRAAIAVNSSRRYFCRIGRTATSRRRSP